MLGFLLNREILSRSYRSPNIDFEYTIACARARSTRGAFQIFNWRARNVGRGARRARGGREIGGKRFGAIALDGRIHRPTALLLGGPGEASSGAFPDLTVGFRAKLTELRL